MGFSAMAERFGRYQLSKLAGTGGMAQVHLARQVGPSGFVKPCVLKRIVASYAGDEQVRKMFLEEARISALLNHPHIVQTFDYGEVDGTPYMAMELVDGVNLAQLCRTLAKEERWIPLRSCVEICIAIAEALAYAHGLTDLDGRNIRLVHRDVSPQNILVSRQGGVKLSDFGIARHDTREHLTQGPSAKGKPGYMAPEQAMGGEIDSRADLFALGIVLTELISARRVLRSGQPVANLLAVSKRVKELVDLRQDAPEDLKKLALALTALEPDDRPSSARDVADMLRRSASKIPERTSLSVFLEKVFQRFFPNDVLGANTMTPSPGSNSNFSVADPRAPLSATKAKPAEDSHAQEEADPTRVDPPANFDREAWTKEPEVREPAAAVYEQGWPKEYLDKGEPPQIELVARSSSVDAMKFFQAQGSSRPASDPKMPVVQGSVPPPAGDVPPSSGPGPRKLNVLPALPGTPVMPGAPASNPNLAPSNLPKVLQLGLEDQKELKPPPPWLKYIPLVGAGLGIALVGFGILALASMKGKEEKKPVIVQKGSVHITSSPPGATIFIDGMRSTHTTPYEVAELPVDKPIRLAVTKEGFLSVPTEATIVIPGSTRKTNASFTLRRGRVFHLQTTPPNASVEINGSMQGAITPMDLAPMPMGDTATLSVTLDGYMPAHVLLKVEAATATVVDVKLELGRQVDIVSEPPGAKVTLDNTPRGVTPIYDVLVPNDRPFKLKIERKGYKPWKQTMTGKKLKERLIQADLDSLPLLAMPMSKEEREEAKDYDRRMNRTELSIKNQKAKLAKAEKLLAQVESSPNIFIGRIADAQRDVDEARTRVEELENERTELESAIDLFRQKIMSKLDVNE